MNHEFHRRKLHWLCETPTPYNDFLFHSLANDPDIDLTVHFRRPFSVTHPWQSHLAEGYSNRFYHSVLGVDWHLLAVAKREKQALFVLAGWNHLTVILLTTFLVLTCRSFVLWTDTPNLRRKRSRLLAVLRSCWLKWVFRRATYVMGTGSPGVEALAVMGVPKAKLINFPYFVNLKAYAREIVPFPSDSAQLIRFISAGRLQTRLKGHDVALRAFAIASQRSANSFEYIIAGSGPDETKSRGLAKELGLLGQVRFLGWVEPDDLRYLYCSAHGPIHPSPSHDPYGNAVLEGMAAGLVILGSDVSGAVRDRVDHGVNGFIHRAGDADGLAQQIEFLLKNPERVVEMGHLARVTAEKWPIRRALETVRGIIR